MSRAQQAAPAAAVAVVDERSRPAVAFARLRRASSSRPQRTASTARVTTPLPTIRSDWSRSTSGSTRHCRRSTPLSRRSARRLPRGARRAAGLSHRAHQRGNGAGRDRPRPRGGGTPSRRAASARRVRPTCWPSSASRCARPATCPRPRCPGTCPRAGGAANPELANDLGVVYARLGRAAEARALFKELLGRDPDDAATWNNLGVLELSSGRPGRGGRGVSPRR